MSIMASLIALGICIGLIAMINAINNAINNDVVRKMQNEHNMPVDAKVVSLLVSCETLDMSNFFDYRIWVSDNRLKIAQFGGDMFVDIPMSNVKGFARMSDVINKNVSFGKALVGGALFGSAGAILGGLSGKEQNSAIMLVIEQSGVEHILVVSDYYNKTLISLMPEKQISVLSGTTQESNTNNDSLNDLKALEQLSELRNKGIITDDEFDMKKKQLLGL